MTARRRVAFRRHPETILHWRWTGTGFLARLPQTVRFFVPTWPFELLMVHLVLGTLFWLGFALTLPNDPEIRFIVAVGFGWSFAWRMLHRILEPQLPDDGPPRRDPLTIEVRDGALHLGKTRIRLIDVRAVTFDDRRLVVVHRAGTWRSKPVPASVSGRPRTFLVKWLQHAANQARDHELVRHNVEQEAQEAMAELRAQLAGEASPNV